MERNTGFQEQSFDLLIKYEDWHWWFQSRNKMIVKLIKRFRRQPGQMLEIGCGNGLVTEAISKSFPDADIIGTEFFREGLAHAQARLPDVTFEQLDARDLDGSRLFDTVCAFDVLEHIDADLEVMKAVRRAMRDARSRFFITVPQHMSLWSEADVFAKHERRYSFAEMQQKLKEAGFTIEYRTSYVFLLAPLMFLSRRGKQAATDYNPEDEFNISNTGNRVLSGIMAVEAFLRGLGVPMPFGGSLVVVAKPF
ncbi:MAG: class I SAM-dependent methyltransferase [Pseudomonadota bacterium]